MGLISSFTSGFIDGFCNTPEACEPITFFKASVGLVGLIAIVYLSVYLYRDFKK